MQNHLEMFEFNENYACLKFDLYGIFTTHKYTFYKKNFTSFTCKARVTTSKYIFCGNSSVMWFTIYFVENGTLKVILSPEIQRC